jgi:hypothetical protein
MNTWRAIILAAACAAAVAGCGTSTPPAAGPAGGARASSHGPAPGPSAAMAKKLAALAKKRGARAAASDLARAARTVDVFLEPSGQVPFTGEVTTVTVTAATATGPLRWLRLASVTVGFGDGASVSATESCSGAHQAPAASGLPVRHAYRRAGLFTAQVTSARVCGLAGLVNGGAGGIPIPVLASAPPASASWPPCTQGQLRISASSTGAALGHEGVLFTLLNVSGADCRLLGYPGLQLVASDGSQLPTTVSDATAGTYLFPPVAPHLVALPPGGYAAFQLEYGDNPFGAASSEPYATACPAATQADVFLPGAQASGAVAVAMAPCSGDVWVSPVIPGRAWITFP